MEYIQLKGELFENVQLNHIFRDSKTFVDATPKLDPDSIIKEYNSRKKDKSFNLNEFIQNNFIFPQLAEKETKFKDSLPTGSMLDYTQTLWSDLYRDPDSQDVENTSLIPLPYAYVVPGGRFREVYYWDSFFSLLGLLKSGQIELAKSICDNFAYLIDKVGHIPNGNRLYFTGRSQPPVFAMMISVVSKYVGKDFYKKYLSALEKEYAFWMDGTDSLNKEGESYRRVVKLDDNCILNRYYDDNAGPREEAFVEDTKLAELYPKLEREQLFKDLRAGAESGWDYSSRWFRDYKNIETIRTTEIIPVDLNSILFYVEKTLAAWMKKERNIKKTLYYELKAKQRKEAIQKYCWDSKKQFYFDYCFTENKKTESWTLAAAFPLYFKIARKEQANHVAKHLESKFLRRGGLITTLAETGQQWDSPNGWAPLEWIAIKGLNKYGHENLSNEIKLRWCNMCRDIYNNTGKMYEKYNVVSCTYGGGGEYDPQDGFGWTNGVVLDLLLEKEPAFKIAKYFSRNKVPDFA
jgi:alpha,alpha-trehalase